MARISTYSLDEEVSGGDKWIGSDSGFYNKTKNFTPLKLADYFNSSEKIDSSNSLRFWYQTLDLLEERSIGTISFEEEVGASVPFSGISSFLLSKNTEGTIYIYDFFNSLLESKILLHKADTINTYAIYEVTAIEEYEDNSEFIKVSVSFIRGNGGLLEDKSYLISVIDFALEAGFDWGSIEGTLSDQTDLQEALDLKANIEDVPTLISELTNDSGFITLADIPPIDISSKLDKNFSLFTDEPTPIDTDLLVIYDGDNKNVTFGNLKATLKTYFDGIYTTTSAVATQITTALVGYATESFVTSQGYITNVITALGYLPLNEDFSTLPTASLPLSSSDTLVVNQSGVPKEVAVSEFGGGETETFEQSRWQFNDFVTESSNLYPFIGSAVNGGNIFFNLVTGDNILKHKQIIRSGASANGGYRVQTNGNTSNPFFSATGLCFFGIFRIDSRSDARNRIVRIGYYNSINQNAPSDGAFLEIIGNDATFKVIYDSVETSSATFALSSSTGELGYRILIEWISNTSVKCKLVDTSNNVVFDITHSTNVPATNKRFNCGVVATNTTAGTNIEILQLDYMGFGTAKPNFLNEF